MASTSLGSGSHSAWRSVFLSIFERQQQRDLPTQGIGGYPGTSKHIQSGLGCMAGSVFCKHRHWGAGDLVYEVETTLLSFRLQPV